MKKVVIILVIILIIAAIGIGVYFGLQKSNTSGNNLNNQISGGNLPIGSTGNSSTTGVSGGNTNTGNLGNMSDEEKYLENQKNKLSIFSTQPIIGYWVVASSSTSTPSRILAVTLKGEVVEIKDGKEEILISSNYGVPLKLVSNKDGSKAVVSFANNSYALFDVSTKAWQELDKGIVAIAFAPTGSQLIYVKSSDNTSSFYIKDFGSTKKTVTLVASLAIQDFNITWPDANKIFIIPKPSYGFMAQAWYFDLKQKTLNQFAMGQGLGMVFSPSFDFGLKFSNKDRSNFNVSIINKTGEVLADMPFSTLSFKCSFEYEKKLAFCAIPESYTQNNPLLPDEYLKGAVMSLDSIYKIDLDSSEITEVINSNVTSIDFSDIKAMGGYLYFINKYDGLLYRFKLD
ncbi:MAG TPA: hypothetical protein PK367_00185 [Candidatus Paceibacterota bacterium]|nr:hypothetical protein [Candidatus Paceibacterota bacterium]